MNRPYLQLKTTELYRVWIDSNSNKDVLIHILEELEHRSSKYSRKLKKTLESELLTIQGVNSTSTKNADSLPLFGTSANSSNVAVESESTMPHDINLLNDIKRHAHDLRDDARSQLLNIRENSATGIDIIDELPDQIYKTLTSGTSFEFDDLEIYYDRNEIDPDDEPDVSLILPDDDDLNQQDHHQDKQLQTLTERSKLEKRLDRTRNRAKGNIEEKGYNNLFFTLGYLQYERLNQPEESKLAPLFLIPVILEREHGGGNKNKVSASGEECRTNSALREILEAERNCSLPDFEDDAEITPEDYLENVKAWIAQNDLPFEVIRRARIDQLPYRNESIIMDLDPEGWGEQDISRHELIRTALYGEGVEDQNYIPEDYDDTHPIGGSLCTPLPADPSQIACMIDVLEGKSLVIDGPPGTGKSQTIANLIALLISEKKSVLFIAEKRVALDVVYRRLEEIGLHHYALRAHSETATSTAALKHLNDRLWHCRAPNFDLATYEERLSDLHRERDSISKYLTEIHEPQSPLEMSIWDMMWCHSKLYDSGCIIHHTVPDGSIPSNKDDFKQRIAVFIELHDVLECSTDHPRLLSEFSAWEGIDASGYLLNDREIIRSLAEDIKASMHEAEHLLSTPSLSGAPLSELRRLGSDSLSKLIAYQLETDCDTGLLDLNMSKSDALQSQRMLLQIKSILTDIDSAWLDVTRESIDDVIRTFESGIPNSTLSAKLRDVLDATEHLDTAWRLVATSGDRFDESGHGPWTTVGNTVVFINTLRLIEKLTKHLQKPLLNSHLSAPQLDEWSNSLKTWKTLSERRQELEAEVDFHNLPGLDVISVLVSESRALAPKRFKFLRPSWRQLKRQITAFARDSNNVTRLATPDSLLGIRDYLHDEDAWLNSNSSLTRFWRDAHPNSPQALEEFNKGLDYLHQLRDLQLQHNVDPALIYETKRNLSAPYNSSQLEELITPLFKWLRDDKLSPLEDAPIGSIHWDEIKKHVDKCNELHMVLAELYRQHNGLGATALTDVLSQIQFVLDIEKVINELVQYGLNGVRVDPALPVAVEHACVSCEFINLIRTAPFGQEWQDRLLNSPTVDTWNSTKACLVQLNSLVIKCLQSNNDLRTRLSDTQIGSPEDPSMTLNNCMTVSDAVINSLEDLPTWKQLCRLKRRGFDQGLSIWVNSVISGERSPSEAKSDYEGSIYQHLININLHNSQILLDTNGSMLSAARERYQEIDQQLIEMSKAKFANSAFVPRDQISLGNAGRKVTDRTERRLIEHYATRNPRRRKLRWVFKRASKAIPQATPCILMSPTSVAEVLPKQLGMFDVVIFDEASQLRPASAYGGLLRAKSAVVVGDPNQLPPTTFFSFGGDDDIELEDETVADGGESILDIVTTNFGSGGRRRLKVHYRSEHESLIAFSNHYFYDNELTIFPSTSSISSGSQLGVFLEPANGLYQTRQNLIEANAVVDAVIDHARQHEHNKVIPSLGIATFNRQQADLIEYILYDRSNQDPTVARLLTKLESRNTEGLFIKNLERVQGDERDVIFISYTFGPEETGGRVAQRFGPLNLENGWRRLNVLVTRAKQQVRVFTSMRPGDISADVGNKGRIAMRDYLQYADKGVLPDHGTVFHKREPDSDFEISVAKALHNFGVEPIYQVGVSNYFIDIGVRLPGENTFFLGIECDGLPYHSSRTARERDAIREEQIRRKGWDLYRIWSTDWYQNRNSAIEKLERAVEEARAKHLGQTTHGITEAT